jgi:hypothetical protein
MSTAPRTHRRCQSSRQRFRRLAAARSDAGVPPGTQPPRRDGPMTRSSAVMRPSFSRRPRSSRSSGSPKKSCVEDEILIVADAPIAGARTAIRLLERDRRRAAFPTVRVSVHAGPAYEDSGRRAGGHARADGSFAPSRSPSPPHALRSRRQQPTDAEPEPLGRGGSPVPSLLPLVRRATGASGDLGRRWALTPRLSAWSIGSSASR